MRPYRPFSGLHKNYYEKHPVFPILYAVVSVGGLGWFCTRPREMANPPFQNLFPFISTKILMPKPILDWFRMLKSNTIRLHLNKASMRAYIKVQLPTSDPRPHKKSWNDTVNDLHPCLWLTCFTSSPLWLPLVGKSLPQDLKLVGVQFRLSLDS